MRAMQRFVVGGWALVPWIEAACTMFTGLPRNVVVADERLPARSPVFRRRRPPGWSCSAYTAAATELLDLFLAYQGLLSANQVENAFSAGLQFRF